MNNLKTIKFVYFSTGFFGEAVLKHLLAQGIKPKRIITSPDRPVGRHQIVEDGPIKKLAVEHGIPHSQPEKLKAEEFLTEFKSMLDEHTICVVADYGKILPQVLLDLKTIDFINIHPSLLPLYRGPSPLQNTILNDNRKTGVTIIQMDDQMDHGPIVGQKEIEVDEAVWPCSTLELSELLSKVAADLLTETLVKYENGTVTYTEQDHDKAVYVKMIEKKDAEVFPETQSIESIYRTYQAFKMWPEAFYINKDGKRVKIKRMNKDKIERIITEGKSESDFQGF